MPKSIKLKTSSWPKKLRLEMALKITASKSKILSMKRSLRPSLLRKRREIYKTGHLKLSNG